MFFKSLFDFKFENFVTRQVASVMYAILLVVLGLASFFGVLWSLAQAVEMAQWNMTGGVIAYFLLAVVGIPLIAFLYLVILRVAFESSIALVMIAENTKRQNN